jgi:hypothetical protein
VACRSAARCAGRLALLGAPGFAPLGALQQVLGPPLAVATFAIPGRATRHISLRLTAYGRSVLRGRRTLRALLLATPAAPGAASLTRPVTIRVRRVSP